MPLSRIPALISIGALSEATGVNIETIRYYEREGLLPKPPRSSGGRRLYDGASVRKLSFLRRCRELGFSLAEAQALAALAGREDTTCAEVKGLVSRHLDDVRGKLKDLRRLERSLSAMANSCPGSASTDCPILESLDAPRAGLARSRFAR